MFFFFHLEYKSKMCLIERHTLWFLHLKLYFIDEKHQNSSQTSDPEKAKKLFEQF